MTQHNHTNKIAHILGGASKKLLATTAMTAVGLLAMSGNAKADNWVDLSTTSGSTTTDLSQANTTNLGINSGRAVVEGDLDINANWTVNVGKGDLVAIDRENDPTFIYGRLNCAGSCHVLDNNGVFVGEGGSVDAVGIATLSDGELMDTTRFMETGDVTLGNFSNVSTGVTNKGTITAGFVGLVSPVINNDGLISAKMGKVVMAAGEVVTLDMYGDGLVEVAVDGELADGLIQNTGRIEAEGGEVLITASVAKQAVENVINMGGVVDVSSATVKGGKIILSGGSKGKVTVAGKLKASGTKGGNVDVTGQIVDIADTAEITADGDNEGGRVYAYGTDKAIFRGSISARDLADGGNGGFIEVSGEDLKLAGTALVGQGGTIVYDPHTLNIDAAAAASLVVSLGGGGTIIAQARNTINVNAAIDSSAQANVATLRLKDQNSNGFLRVNLNDTIVLGASQNLIGDGTEVNVASTGLIQNGVDVSASGATVNVADGTYNEYILVDKALTLLGANAGVDPNAGPRGPESTVFAAPGPFGTAYGFKVTSSDVTIDGFNIDADGAGITLDGGVGGTSNLTVKNNIITTQNIVDADDEGVQGDNVDNVVVMNNQLNTIGNSAIRFGGSSNVDVLGNVINNPDSDGVVFNDVTGGQIDGNTINDTNVGIRVTDSEDILVGNKDGDNDNGNTVDGAATGVEVNGGDDIEVVDNTITDVDNGVVANSSENIQIAENSITGSSSIGIDVDDSESADIDNNIVTHFTTGIQVTDSDLADIEGNTVTDITANGIEADGSLGVDIKDNNIGNAAVAGDIGGDAVHVTNSVAADVRGNTIRNADGDGIELISSDSATVGGLGVGDANNIANVLGHGIASFFGTSPDIIGNIVSRIGMNGIHLQDGTDAQVRSNTVSNTVGDGIESNNNFNIQITDNMIGTGSFANNIRGQGVDVNGSDNADILRNTVTETVGIGVSVNPSDDVVIDDNTISNTDQHGIHVQGGNDIQITNNNLTNTGAFGWSGIVTNGSTLVRILSNVINGTGWDGIQVANGSDIEVRDNDLDNITISGIAALTVDDVLVDNNTVDVAQRGIYTGNATNTTLNNNNIDTTSNDGIEANNSANIQITNNKVGTDAGALNIGAEGIDVNNSPSADILGNMVNNTGHNGISVNPSPGSIINGNTINNAGWDGVNVSGSDNVQVINNIITNTLGASGVAIINSADALVDNNDIDRSARLGVYVGNGDRVNINNNRITNSGLETGLDWSGIQIEVSDAGRVTDNVVRYATLDGINLGGPINTVNGGNTGLFVVDNNRVDNTGRDGAHVVSTDNAQVTNNRIGTVGGANNIGDDGVHINGSNGALVNLNTIVNTVGAGVHVNPSSGVTVSNTTIDNTGSHGIFVEDSENTNILTNLIGTNGGAENINGDGVLLDNSDGSNIKGNTITETKSPANGFGSGIQVVDSDDVTVGGDGADKNFIKGVDWDGIRVVNADNINIRKNEITNVERTGIFGKDLTNSRIVRNIIDGAKKFHGIHLKNGDNVLVHRNKIDDVKKNGILTDGTANLTVSKNNVDTTGIDGIHIKASHGAQVTENKVGTDAGPANIGEDGIHINGSNGANVAGNTVNNTVANGILVNPSDNVQVHDNIIADVAENGVKILGGTGHDVRRNNIRRAGNDGITIRDHEGDKFGSAWIAYNDIKWTGDDGIHVENGNFVSIYDNYIDLSGFLPNPGPFPANVEVGKDANGIYAENIGGGDLPPLAEESEGFGHSYYGAAVEIHGNDIANVEDDGVQVKDSDSTYIGRNIIGHVGDDGVDVDDVDYTKVAHNAVTLAGDKGITIDGGHYAGVFDNRVLLTGSDGIQVENVRYDHETDIAAFGDEEYGHGWAVNVSGNDVALTGDDGIEVRNSDATKVQKNNVFMAGLGEGFGGIVDTINSFASETFNPALAFAAAPKVVPEEYYNGFEWEWGNGHGINVHGIDGAYYSPNGWAADIRGNNVKYTGGHGIRAEDNDRTRINNNTVKYAGIDYTAFHGAHNMLEMLNSGPFKSEGRRDLWMSTDESLVSVMEGYFGQESEEEPDEEKPYISISHVGFDNHDGIHAGNIFNQFLDGESGANYLFALKIKGNDVRITGDDGIEVHDSGRTLIAENTIRDAGYGGGEEYGSGGYDGADGIRVTNVIAPVGDVIVRASGLEEEPAPEEEGYNYEPNENYALIIRNNDIERTADDGIEVVGGNNILASKVLETGPQDEDTKKVPHYYGITDRVLIAENTVSETGYFDNDFDVPEPGLKHGYENVGPDGYGHDGIHVRNINGANFYGDVLNVAASGYAGGGDGARFTGYAVDVLNNDVRKTGDDGIEVFNSDSTLILGNTVRQSGVYWNRKGRPNTDGADYYGADGIHVRNVGGNNIAQMQTLFAGEGEYSGDGFEPYSVAIVDNDVRKTADDGIEVVGENNDQDDWNDDWDEIETVLTISDDWDEDAYQYNGTGRTLILANTTRDNGVSGYYGHSESNSYDSRTGSSYSHERYGNRGSYDGYGGDGIHVRGVGSNNNPNPWIGDTITAGSAGDAGGPVYGRGDYVVKIIGNNGRRTGDDGIEVIGTAFDDRNLNINALDGGWYPSEGGDYRVLIEGNFVKKAGLSGGSYHSDYHDYAGYDEGGYFWGHSNNYGYDYHGNAGDDGYGADGIHVRNVGAGYNDSPWTMAGLAGSGDEGGSYVGYAVDIIGNTVRKTGDDGIEVRNSDSTFIAHNDVKNAGKLSRSRYSYHYENSGDNEGSYDNHSSESETWRGGSSDEGNYTGGDGIHVENVGTNGFVQSPGFAGGVDTGNGFEEYAVVIYDNTVDKSSDDGIEVLDSGRTRIEMNDVSNSGLARFSGYEEYSESSAYDDYGYMNTGSNGRSSRGAGAHDGRGSDGIHVGGVDIDENHESDGWETAQILDDGPYDDYDHERRRIDSVEIIGNTVDESADDGIQVVDSGDTLIKKNTVSNSGTATFEGDEEGEGGPAPVAVTDDYDDYYEDYGYRREYSGVGELDATGGDGINVSRDRIRPSKKKPPRGGRLALASESLDVQKYEDEGRPVRVRIINNDVTNSADDGVEVIGSMTMMDGYDYDYDHDYRPSRRDITNVIVKRNEIENSGDNGIALITGNIFGHDDDNEKPEISLISGYGYGSGSRMNSRTIDNEVTNSGNNGLFVGGPNHNRVIVSGNTFTDFDIGAHFESGKINLTGDGNRFNGGRVGMRFAPAEIHSHYDVKTLGPDPMYAPMKLIDDTIGAQTFDGQSQFYVELDNGAFFNPGTPTLLRENDSTFVNTPFGTFTPSVDYPGGYPPAVLAYLESMFYHYNDDGSLGLFFLEPGGDIAQERIFNEFDPFDGGLGGLNVTILGLPTVPGGPAPTPTGGPLTPAQLNNIQTAAGGETDPEALNAIETAAGSGEETSCWNDALNGAGAGQTTTLNYDGSAEGLLNGEVGCAAPSI